MLEDSEDMSGMSGTGAHLIIGESHVHAAMALIVHYPMGLDSL